MEQELEKTKNFIKSLLTSSPLTCTMRQLCNDYENTIGERIPFHKMGYRTVYDFFISIDDTVKVIGDGPYAQVLPIITEKSAHINEMVTRQKVPVARKSSRKCFNQPAKRYTMPLYPQPHMMKKIQYPRPFTQHSNHYSQNVSRFQSHTYMDGRSNRNSTESYEPGYPSSTYKWVKESSQKIAERTEPHPYENSNFRTDNTNCCTENANSRTYNTNSRTDNTNTHIDKTTCRTNETDPKKENKPKISATHFGHGSLDDEVPSRTSDTKYSVLNPDHKKIEFSVKTSSAVRKLPRTSHSSHSNHLKTERPLKPKLIPESHYSYTNVPLKLQQELKAVIGMYSEGIWCARFPEAYRKMFKKDLNYRIYGFRSLIDMCVSLGNIFHYVRPGLEDFKLYDKSKPLPSSVEKTFTLASYSNVMGEVSGHGFPKLDWADYLSFIPGNIFPLGEEIPRGFIPSSIQEEDEVDVVVVEIYDPSKFWIYLCDSPLDDMMNKMQVFYKEKNEAYRVPKKLQTEGLYCTSIIYEEYHRALIVDVLPDDNDLIKVLYIDYGTLTKTNMNNVCFLDKEFSALPWQQIRCRLANILPIQESSPWPIDAIRAFQNAINKRTITATIKIINREDKSLEVFLADVTDSKRIYIHETLVQAGVAQYHFKERTKSIIDPHYKTLVDYIHWFPTFDELEYGLAPNIQQMLKLYNADVPLNFCIPQYFVNNNLEEIEISRKAIEFCESHFNSEVIPHDYNIDEIKNRELDMDVFGEFAEEMKQFTEEVQRKKNENENGLVDVLARFDSFSHQGVTEPLIDVNSSKETSTTLKIISPEIENPASTLPSFISQYVNAEKSVANEASEIVKTNYELSQNVLDDLMAESIEKSNFESLRMLEAVMKGYATSESGDTEFSYTHVAQNDITEDNPVYNFETMSKFLEEKYADKTEEPSIEPETYTVDVIKKYLEDSAQKSAEKNVVESVPTEDRTHILCMMNFDENEEACSIEDDVMPLDSQLTSVNEFMPRLSTNPFINESFIKNEIEYSTSCLSDAKVIKKLNPFVKEFNPFIIKNAKINIPQTSNKNILPLNVDSDVKTSESNQFGNKTPEHWTDLASQGDASSIIESENEEYFIQRAISRDGTCSREGVISRNGEYSRGGGCSRQGALSRQSTCSTQSAFSREGDNSKIDAYSREGAYSKESSSQNARTKFNSFRNLTSLNPFVNSFYPVGDKKVEPNTSSARNGNTTPDDWTELASQGESDNEEHLHKDACINEGAYSQKEEFNQNLHFRNDKSPRSDSKKSEYNDAYSHDDTYSQKSAYSQRSTNDSQQTTYLTPDIGDHCTYDKFENDAYSRTSESEPYQEKYNEKYQSEYAQAPNDVYTPNSRVSRSKYSQESSQTEFDLHSSNGVYTQTENSQKDVCSPETLVDSFHTRSCASISDNACDEAFDKNSVYSCHTSMSTIATQTSDEIEKCEEKKIKSSVPPGFLPIPQHRTQSYMWAPQPYDSMRPLMPPPMHRPQVPPYPYAMNNPAMGMNHPQGYVPWYGGQPGQCQNYPMPNMGMNMPDFYSLYNATLANNMRSGSHYNNNPGPSFNR